MIGEIFKSNGFGYYEVISYKNAHNVTVRFLETGYEKTTNKSNIIRGAVKDKFAPSCYGVGINGTLPSRINGVLVAQYQLWSSIIQRCYDNNYQIKQPSYKGCVVSDNFKNYEYFYDWCNKQVGFGNEGWQLDKDLLSSGGNSYHEDHCVFIPQYINILFNNNSKNRGACKIGVTLNRDGKFYAKVSMWGKQVFLGSFKTEDEAYEVYKSSKESYVKEVADKYKGKIDHRVYEYLNNFKLEVS